MHKQQVWPQAWEYCQAKLIQTLGRASQGENWSWSQCIKSHHTQTSSVKGLLSHFWNINIVRSILPGLRKKELDCCSVVQIPLFRLKSILHFIWKSRSQSLEEEWRGTESMLLEVQCEVFTVSDDLGCHVICWCWSTVFSEVHSQHSLQGDFRALYASFCWQALFFPSGLATFPHCQRYQKLVQWPWCYCAWLASKIAWPEPHRESMGYCQEEDERHQTQQCRWPEGRYQSNLGFHNTWAVPRADRLHATPHWCSDIVNEAQVLHA